ncbi:response regulator transcription factor [Methylocystis heyeri]|uniref:Response regulator n=1 Tax=Methylocystis heyeri TaxID=391905 RepID=A0A6B8KJZ5_9HYPH|nr:response regulator transcription factor [Methylocystis heyeri]QGM47411.1 response regulator [Methylocystis heyeri]
MSDSAQKILVVEDDPEIAETVTQELRQRGYLVSHAETGAKAMAEIERDTFDLVILDRMLPEIDGLAIVESMRKENASTPILIVSALGEVEDRVDGLKGGADDYLVKPFSLAEMDARVEALLRRPLLARAMVLRGGALSLDLVKRQATLDGKSVELSAREFQLLEYFMARPGQLVTRDMLIQKVWKYRFSPQTNVVDVHISKLRRKIDRDRSKSYIQNIRGCGFMFNAEL